MKRHRGEVDRTGRGELFGARNESHDDRNAVNPRIGSGMQQARKRPEEEAAEVVQNHEGGTCGEGGSFSAEARLQGPAGVDSGSHVDEGEFEAREARKGGARRDEAQERKVGEIRPGRNRSFERERRPRRPTRRCLRTSKERSPRKTPKASRRRHEGPGGSREVPTTCYASATGSPSQRLEGHVNPTRAPDLREKMRNLS